MPIKCFDKQFRSEFSVNEPLYTLLENEPREGIYIAYMLIYEYVDCRCWFFSKFP